MVFEVNPLFGQRAAQPISARPDSDWQWLDQQKALSDASSYKRPGTFGGGATIEQVALYSDPTAFTRLPEPPALTSPLLTGRGKGDPVLDNLYGNNRRGALDLNMIDPFTTLGNATGAFLFGESTQPPLGTEGFVFDPGAYLASRDIDIFSHSDTGFTGRMLDFWPAYLGAVGNLMSGTSGSVAPPTVQGSALKYRFQNDYGYWQLIDRSTDQQLRGIARNVASRYEDVDRSTGLTEQLYEQFKLDQEVLKGFSSGDKGIDYIAKQNAYTYRIGDPSDRAYELAQQRVQESGGLLGMVGRLPGDAFDLFASLVGGLPLIGGAVAETLNPIDAEAEEYWRSLPQETRHDYLGQAGMVGGAVTLASFLPLLSGMGAVLAVSKGAAGIPGLLYRGYNVVLKTTEVATAISMAGTMAHWAVEAAVPAYGESMFARDVDRSRPISSSVVAGVVNELGLWTGFGLPASAAAAARGVKAVGLSRVGAFDLPLMKSLGGSATRRELANAGLDENLTILSQKSFLVSRMMNREIDDVIKKWDAAIAGKSTGDAFIDALSTERKIQMADEELTYALAGATRAVETKARILTLARERPGPLASDETRRMYAFARAASEAEGAVLRAAFEREYGPTFLKNLTGGSDVASMRAWAQGSVARQGGDPTKLGRHDAAGWANTVRALYQREFHSWNAQLIHAAQGSDEAARISIMTQRSLFKDEVDDALATLRGDDLAAAQAEAARLIGAKDKLGTWFADTYKPTEGATRALREVDPHQLADHIEDIAPTLSVRRAQAAPGSANYDAPLNALQRQLDDEGLWTIGFHPIDDATGAGISYARTRGGTTFKSPWLDYPVENVANIEIGNRGWLMSKYDSIFGGFRSVVLTEFQRASLHRSLSGKFAVTPEQIDVFHARVLNFARESHIQPQTIGTVGQLPEFPLAKHIDTWVEKAAKETFGVPRNAAGDIVQINWLDEIAHAYRQSFKLNMTAGLTSYLKTLGPGGHMLAYGTDILYPAFRFGLSPVFKASEVFESAMLNAMRLGRLNISAEAKSLYRSAGVGNEGRALFTQELTLEPSFAKLAEAKTGRLEATALAEDASNRSARGLVFHSRLIPEDMALATERAQARGAAEAAQAGRPAPREWTNPGARPGRGPVDESLSQDAKIAIYQERRAAEQAWTSEMNYGVATGRISPDDAKALGWDPGRPIEPLPDTLYHATTSLSGIEKAGLKTRDELGGRVALGGGDSDVISFTADKAIADRIAEVFVEARAVLRGEVTTPQLLERAKGLGFKGELMKGGVANRPSRGMTPAQFDRFYVQHMKPQFESLAANEAEMVARHGDLGWRPAPRARRFGTDNYMQWERPMTEAEIAEANFDLYRTFLLHQEARGGAMDPLFFSPDLDMLRNLDPADVGVVRATPIPGAQGMKMGSLGEWRTWTGDAVEVGEEAAARAAARVRSERVVREDAIPDDFTMDGALFEPGFYDPALLVEERGLWHATTAMDAVHAQGLRSGREAGRTGLGPGMRATDRNFVSVATDEAAAQEIAERLTLASRAAKNEATVADILDHFGDAARYGDDIDAIANAVSAPARARASWGELERHLERVGRTGQAKYQLVKELDDGLSRYTDEGVGHVGLTASFDDMVALDPAQIGVVRVAARKTAKPQTGQDVGELRFDPDDVRVIDQRPAPEIAALPPLARDTEGLLRQLRATMAQEPTRAGALRSELDDIIGENGVIPGLEGRAQDILDELQRLEGGWLDDAPTMKYALQTKARRAEIRADLERRLLVEPGASERTVGKVYNDNQRLFGVANRMDEVAGTDEAFGRVFHDWAADISPRKEFHDAIQTILHPGDYKLDKALSLQIQLMREKFPDLLRAAGMEGNIRVFQQLGLKPSEWADWLIEDRRLASIHSRTRTPESLQKLLDHAKLKGEVRGEFDRLYASDEWQTVTALWDMNSLAATDEAFRVHFWSTNRSAFERTINHPVLAFYPASWAYKTAREWFRFLYNNRMFGELRLGMSPAAAIADIRHAQQVAFAQDNDFEGGLDEYLRYGPLGSSLFIFNLLLPGDWSSVPFSTSRTIREIWRGLADGNLDVARIAEKNFEYLGVGRDVFRGSEALFHELPNFLYSKAREGAGLPSVPLEREDDPYVAPARSTRDSYGLGLYAPRADR